MLLQALKDNSFVCCLSKKNVLIYGRKLSVNGFPYISQDNESITCSEATIINVFDYFGTKYPEYSILLPSSVNKILAKQSYQRQLPAQGLPTENISYVLKKLGFGTVVYSSDKKDRSSDIYEAEEFKELLFIYIESGIPIIATLSSGKNYHAVLAIGREEITKDIIVNKNFFSLFKKKSNYFSDFFYKLLVMNDNHPPYEMVDFFKPIYDPQNNSYYTFQSFIVPLYSRVHLEAYQFKKFFFKIIESFEVEEQTSHIKFRDDKGNCIYRFFLTSSKSYKNYIVNSKTISDNFKSLVIEKAMPKFIWVGEIIEDDRIYQDQIVQSIIVVDATESGLTNHLIFATNSQYLILKNSHTYPDSGGIEDFQKKYPISNLGKETLYSFRNNLKGKHTKWQN